MDDHPDIRALVEPYGYGVDAEGNTYSRRPRNGKGPLVAVWRRVAQSPGSNGYLTMAADGRRYLVHRLVAAAFIGPCPDGFEVSHNDGDQLNCRAGNLEYLTHAQNEALKLKHGTHSRGSRNGAAKLTEAQVIEIRRLFASSAPPRGVDIARRFGVSQSIVSNIRHGTRWKHAA